MNWIYLAIPIGGVFVMIALIRAVSQLGGNGGRGLLFLTLTGCFMAGSFLLMQHRRQGGLFAHRSPVISVAVAPQVSEISPKTTISESKMIEVKRLGHNRTVHHKFKHAIRPSSDRTFFEANAGDRVFIDHASNPPNKVHRARVISIAGMGLAALAVIAVLYLGYLFLDAGTRGQFTWLLRITSIVAFAVICLVVALVRQRM